MTIDAESIRLALEREIELDDLADACREFLAARDGETFGSIDWPLLRMHDALVTVLQGRDWR